MLRSARHHPAIGGVRSRRDEGRRIRSLAARLSRETCNLNVQGYGGGKIEPFPMQALISKNIVDFALDMRALVAELEALLDDRLPAAL